MKLWITILFILCATACQSEPERATYLSFTHTESGASCDGPCETVIVDSCRISVTGGPILIAKMPIGRRDIESMPNSCDPTPPTYSSSYRRVTITVEEGLYGSFNRGDRVEVLVLGSWFPELKWEKDDHLLLMIREDQGEWFVGGARPVELHTVEVQVTDNNQIGPGEDIFDLPSKISDLRAELADVNQDYAQQCDYQRLTDAEFNYGVRHDPNCDFVGTDSDNNLNADEGTNNDDEGL